MTHTTDDDLAIVLGEAALHEAGDILAHRTTLSGILSDLEELEEHNGGAYAYDVARGMLARCVEALQAHDAWPQAEAAR